VTSRQSIFRQVVPVLALALLACLLWLPFRFNVGFSGDEWYFYLHSSYTPIWGQPSRPLIALPNYIGYVLSPGYFTGFNVMLMLATFLRGGLSFAILRRLGVSRALAFATGAIAILFPADNGIYYMGALAVYYSSTFYLLAFYLLISYWQRPYFPKVLVIWLLQLLCLGMYEASYPLILLSPLVLFALGARFNREFWKSAILWYLIPALNVLRYPLLLQLKPEAFTYQSSLITQPAGTGDMVTALLNIYERHFVGGWFPGTFPVHSEWLPFAILAGLVTFGVCVWLSKHDDPGAATFHTNRTFILILAGLAIIGLAIAVYLPTSARQDHIRTYYVSAIGAALVIAALLKLLVRRPLLYAVLIGVLATLGCQRLLEQGSAYDEASEIQQSLVLQTIELVPDPKPYSAMVILDETPNQLWETYFHLYWSLQNPFLIAYHDPTLMMVSCPVFATGEVKVLCEFDADRLNVYPGGNPDWSRRYDELVFLRYTNDGELLLVNELPEHPAYDPFKVFDPDATPPAEIYEMFGESRPAES
jgi:hypothetical protein